jgi:integrase
MNDFQKCPLIEGADKTVSAQQTSTKKSAWNKGISVGKKLGLTRKQVKGVFRSLKSEVKKNLFTTKAKKTRSLRDLAMFSLAIDSFLRSGDLMNLKFHEVFYSNGEVKQTFEVQQGKTKKNVTCAISPKTAKILKQWYQHQSPSLQDHLFPGCGTVKSFSTRQYRRLIKIWVSSIQLIEDLYSTHSMRRTKAMIIYDKFKDLQIVRLLLGHASILSSQEYVRSDNSEALSIASSLNLF